MAPVQPEPETLGLRGKGDGLAKHSRNRRLPLPKTDLQIVSETQDLKRAGKICRQRCLKDQAFPCDRMRKGELESMQSLAHHARIGSTTINAVPDQGVPDVRHMHPNLMGSTRPQGA